MKNNTLATMSFDTRAVSKRAFTAERKAKKNSNKNFIARVAIARLPTQVSSVNRLYKKRAWDALDSALPV